MIDFDDQPVQSRVPSVIPFPQDQKDMVDIAVQELLSKGAIIQSEVEEDQFISTIFVVHKPNGKFRPIINLKFLNEFVQYNHFKQETFNIVLDLVQPNDFMTKIDLADAYFSIPIHPSHWKYLKFYWNSILYCFVCLPFGLTIAPYLFTKILRPIFAWFRQQNIRSSYYIDDSINFDQVRAVCQRNSNRILDTLQSLGFNINQKKSVLIPCQRLVFFGHILDTVQFKVFLTDEKVQKIISKASGLLKRDLVRVRDLASFIGLVISTFHAILEAPLHYRPLERDKLVGLGYDGNYDNETRLSPPSRHELVWWIDNVERNNGKRIRPVAVSRRCRTDASFAGFGGIDLDTDVHTNGRWNFEEAQHGINFLELLAIFYTLQSLFHESRDIHIEVQSDNTTAIAYVNKFGGMESTELDVLSKQIWEWCLPRQIYISAIHVPGRLNTADFYSRNFSDSTEWMLKQDIFLRLCRHTFIPDVDLFASRLNKRLPRFVSWFPEPGAIAVNALALSWSKFLPYMFPPFNLIGKVINKIVSDKVDKALLVVPYWFTQSWFPVLLDNMCDFPVRLPRHRDLLVLPHNQALHPLGKKLKMIGVTLSGNTCRVKQFRENLQTLSQCHGPVGQGSSIAVLGKNGVCGTVSGVPVHFTRLKR
ncbi:hypothetical protein BOW52_08340 [Solemya elarraichensis gill symbiont]|uniref:Reverse transcriptase domain-containing protein n=2 Tax=Solemya elarraichensis gill symbiont TaxID=1918949 RepID=A0A1T2L0C8_9GAMM|nr:hypothetical protein BOW52_08340 [Solemya elarraichensis gill symbiont]